MGSLLNLKSYVGIAMYLHNMKLYVVDDYNCIKIIFNHDLTLSSCFCSDGSNDGQLYFPWDVAVDSTGNVNVADFSNRLILIFIQEGQFLRKFGRFRKGNGELVSAGISIDSDNIVYVTEYVNHRVSVFTCEGKFLTSFGLMGNEHGSLTLHME